MIPIIVLLLLFGVPQSALSATPEEEMLKVQQKMKEHKKRLDAAQKRELSVLDELQRVNVRLNKVVTEVIAYRSQLRDTEAKISTVSREIQQTQAEIEKQRDWLKRKLRIMSRYGYSGDMLLQLMNADDIPQLMRTWKYLQELSRHEHGILQSHREALKLLDEKQKQLAVLRKDIARQAARLKEKEDELADQKQDKESLLLAVRSEKETHRKMIAELREAEQRLRRLIEESAKQDTYAGTGFGSARGKLVWPADGKIAVPYGTQKDPTFDTTVFRNGIQIQTDSDAQASAVYQGKVIFAEWFKGFGQLIIINHGNGYHTLYGNLSEIFSRVGDIINEGQPIGKVGVSGILNTYGLYFEIRYKGKPLNPTQWLGRKKQ